MGYFLELAPSESATEMTVRTQPPMMLGSVRNAGHEAVGEFVSFARGFVVARSEPASQNRGFPEASLARVFHSRDTKTCGTRTASEQSSNFGGWNDSTKPFVIFVFVALGGFSAHEQKYEVYFQVKVFWFPNLTCLPFHPLACNNWTR